MRDPRLVRHASFTADAHCQGAMAAKAGVEPRCSVTVADRDILWLLSWPDRDTALRFLAALGAAVDDLTPDLDPPAHIVDLDRLRKARGM